jgi:hypothetical protein
MFPTRPCQYCFSLQGGSVFADFDVDRDGCLCLVRISFDGYGCCDPAPGSGMRKIDRKSSRSVIDAIGKGDVNTAEVAEILRTCFRENKAALWEDALTQHGLI